MPNRAPDAAGRSPGARDGVVVCMLAAPSVQLIVGRPPCRFRDCKLPRIANHFTNVSSRVTEADALLLPFRLPGLQ